MDPLQVVFSINTSIPIIEPNSHHIVAGSFRSLSLFLLAFSPLNRTLSLVSRIPAFGPHQYIATNPTKDRAYTTTWAQPPSLSSWQIDHGTDEAHPWRVTHLNTVPITATSSYINMPPPHTHIYSMGGPTGEVHLLDPSTGAFGPKVQELLFVKPEELETADKTRVALRTGSHGIEFSSSGFAFVPVLGTDCIEIYALDRSTGFLEHLSSTPSPRGPDAHDGPRHVKVHPNGKIVYCVTEHTNYVDTYLLTPPTLTYLSSRSLLPSSLSSTRANYRGDTLLLGPPSPERPAPRTLFATTRGGEEAHNGWLSVFALDDDGRFSDSAAQTESWQLPTSAGKAGALDLFSKRTSSFLPPPSSASSSAENDSDLDAVWILITDDSDSASARGGGVRVLEWDGWDRGGVRIVDEWPKLGGGGDGTEAQQDPEWMEGGSHAVWLG